MSPLSLQITTEDMTYYCAAADKFEMFCNMLLKKKKEEGLPLGLSRNRKRAPGHFCRALNWYN